MIRFLTLITLCLLFSSQLTYSQFTTITTDVVGDGVVTEAVDGTGIAFSFNPANDSLLFEISVDDFNANHSDSFGVNIMVNIPGADLPDFLFWGDSNNTETWHFFLTAWVKGTYPNNYNGTIGIADSAGMATGNYSSLFSNNISITADSVRDKITLGLKRAELIPNSLFMGQELTVAIAAAVGTNDSYSDDIYTISDSMTLIKGIPVDIAPNKPNFNQKPYPNPVDFQLTFNLNSTLELKMTQLFDINGKKVFEGRTTTINVEDLTPGLYTLKVTTTNGIELKEQVVVK